jgi:murein DD-endopeptidase / murein LD-carboxypeptidase
MTRSRRTSVAALLGALSLAAPTPAVGQGVGFDFAFGLWWHDATAHLYTATYRGPILGPVQYGLGLFHLDDSRSPLDRTSTGGEVSLGIGARQRGLYAVGSASLGVRHSDGNADAAWSVGGGYTLRLLPFLALGVDARYRVEDIDVAGFWQLNPEDRRGFLLQARMLIGGHGGGGSSSRPPAPAPVAAPQPLPPLEPVYDGAVSDESARVSVSVAETALAAMGTPYRWGGTDGNGYDCSGLIQWAYGEHGILLPRTSRDQGRTGTAVDRSVAALRPADILTFSENGGGVTHVGLYVGEGNFIHSSSTGVRLSSLTADDPDSRWWQVRWVGARRILE